MCLTLAGVALDAVLGGLSTGITSPNPGAYDQPCFRQAGSLDIHNLRTLRVVLILVLIAVTVALFPSRALNSLSLDNDTVTAFGSKVARTQFIGLLVTTVLCGNATVIVGPIAFIGLMMSYMVRWLAGADYRWSLSVTLPVTPSLLPIADIIGRLVILGELRVSIVNTFIDTSAPIFPARRKSRGGSV